MCSLDNLFTTERWPVQVEATERAVGIASCGSESATELGPTLMLQTLKHLYGCLQDRHIAKLIYSLN